MKAEFVIEQYHEILEIIVNKKSISEKYSSIETLFKQFLKIALQQEQIQFSTTFSKISYLGSKYNIDKNIIYTANHFRHTLIYSSNKKQEVSSSQFLQDVKGIVYFIEAVSNIQIIIPLYKNIQASNLLHPTENTRPKERINSLRVYVEKIEFPNLYATANRKEEVVEWPTIKVNQAPINQIFNPTVEKIWEGATLQLLDVIVEDNNTFIPNLIILEPDYLLDISSLSMCFNKYSNSYLNYFIKKFTPNESTEHIILGNIANQFLDDLVHQKDINEANYLSSMRQIFKATPFEIAACKGLKDVAITKQFFDNTKSQFNNIKRVVTDDFQQQNLHPESAILEPSFFCETVGLQGRLDYFEPNTSDRKATIIELKSGKAGFPETNPTLVKEEHLAQTFLYQFIIQQVLGIPFEELDTYILYSKYDQRNSNLRYVRSDMDAIKKILNIRNEIIAEERALANDTTAVQLLFDKIRVENIVTNIKGNENFLKKYIVPQIESFTKLYHNNNDLVKRYFNQFVHFLAKEQYLAKVGDTQYENTNGISDVWLKPFKEKIASGTILYDLRLKDNQIDQLDPYVKFKIPTYEIEMLPNFRLGDIVLLYERNSDSDIATKKQILKGTIASITPNELIISFRYKQRNKSIINTNSLYAIEADYMDSSFSNMYKGLYLFLGSTPERQALLLGTNLPRFATASNLMKSYGTQAINDIVYKAKCAQDYFLLVGPPGTGKTSQALKSIIEESYYNKGKTILLMAFTNRAVDEICEAIHTIFPKPDYIRIGSTQACGIEYQPHLLKNKLADAQNRNAVNEILHDCNLYIGTVAAISGKMDLLNEIHFDVAIIDEASQLIEPNILGILSACNNDGKPAIDKFILIGDHKQLPAVVLQNKDQSQVKDELLNNIQLNNCSNSLFERLLNIQYQHNNQNAYAMLQHQGRMHPVIAEFANHLFYNSLLDIVPLIHQKNNDNLFKNFDNKVQLQSLLATIRLGFITSEYNKQIENIKSNKNEAELVAKMVFEYYNLCKINNIPFIPSKTLGIITPYRTQIALIKKLIYQFDIPALNDITIDTVERYQGSQRDTIIYSCCINTKYQLPVLAEPILVDGQIVDRKLNVALTRARLQMFIIGNPQLLTNDIIYNDLIQYCIYNNTLFSNIDKTPINNIKNIRSKTTFRLNTIQLMKELHFGYYLEEFVNQFNINSETQTLYDVDNKTIGESIINDLSIEQQSIIVEDLTINTEFKNINNIIINSLSKYSSEEISIIIEKIKIVLSTKKCIHIVVIDQPYFSSHKYYKLFIHKLNNPRHKYRQWYKISDNYIFKVKEVNIIKISNGL